MREGHGWPQLQQLVTARKAARHLLGSGVLVLAEHGNLSRTRECLISLSDEPRPLAKCDAVLRAKDDHSRATLLCRHSFDLFRGRVRCHAVLFNSDLITSANQEARRGIEKFGPSSVTRRWPS